jgi:hypothetical protein
MLLRVSSAKFMDLQEFCRDSSDVEKRYNRVKL